MSIVVPDFGEDRISRLFLNLEESSDVEYHLFTNDYTPSDSTLLGDLTEASGSGYAFKTVPGASWQIVIGNPTTSTATPLVWSFAGNLGLVYGYYVTDSNNALLWVERFDDGPYDVQITSTLTLTPLISVSSGVCESVAAFVDSFSIAIKAADSSSAPTDLSTFVLFLEQGDTTSTPTETSKLSFPAGNFGDSSDVPSDGASSTIRVWAVGCTDNDSSRTAPANTDGQNNATFSDVTTNQQALDVTNPVFLTTGAFAGAPAGTYTSKLLRVYFNIPVRTTATDTLTLSYNIGAGDVVIFTHAGTAALNHNSGTFTFDISALTVAQCQALVFKANYLATVVALPETVLNLDAVTIELVGGF